MKKMKLLLIFCFFAVILSGCGQAPVQSDSGRRVVTQVDIFWQQVDRTTELHCTDAEKMEAVLNYLRALDTLGPADAVPEMSRGNVYTILVRLSDGSRHVYRQRADRYFSKDAQGWKYIDPKQAHKLSLLTVQLAAPTPSPSYDMQ